MLAHLVALLALSLVDADKAFAAGDFATAKTEYRELLGQRASYGAYLGAGRIALYENRLHEAAGDLRHAQAMASNDADRSRTAGYLSEAQTRAAIAAAGAGLNVPQTGLTIPMVAVDPLPLISVKIDGRQAYFILDTGAPGVVIDPQFAAELGIKLQASGSGVFAGGKSAAVQTGTVPVMQLGSLTLHAVETDALPTRMVSFFAPKRVDGIIGTVFLERFLTTIDYPRAQLVLRPRTESAAFERAVPAAATIAPLWFVGDHFLFSRGSINGLANQLLLVDTGLAGGGFMPAKETLTAAHIALDNSRAGQGIGGGGAVTIVPFTVQRLCLWTACRSNIPGSYTPEGTPFGIFPFATAGAISHEFLKYYAVTIDFDAMRIVLE